MSARNDLRPGKAAARAILDSVTPDVRRELIRACIWSAGSSLEPLDESAIRGMIDSPPEPQPEIALADVPVVGPDGKLGNLCDLDLVDMVATVVWHSTLARIRHDREKKAHAALAAKEAEALPQSWRES